MYRVSCVKQMKDAVKRDLNQICLCIQFLASSLDTLTHSPRRLLRNDTDHIIYQLIPGCPSLHLARGYFGEILNPE